MNNDFTPEEIEAAKETRAAVIKDNTPELKAVYMAGEICMWDELQNATPTEAKGKGYSLEQMELCALHMVNYVLDIRGDLDNEPETEKEFNRYISSLPPASTQLKNDKP